jgi:hypothetical protein
MAEKLTIKEASLRLRVSQRVVRERINKGELKATRQLGPNGYFWEVELPDLGPDDGLDYLRQQAGQVTPWWWPVPNNTGQVHYLQNIGIEEIQPTYLCGLMSDNFWDARGHSESDRCPECLEKAKALHLPL